MVEHLDDFLPVDCLFDESVDIAEHALLAYELDAGTGDQLVDQHERDDREYEGEQRERHGQPHHRNQGCECGQQRGEHLREGFRDRLPQGVGVVGVSAHHVAVLVGVEVADRQALLVGEHVIADFLECALLDVDNQPAPQPGAEHADRVHDGEHGERTDQWPPVGVGGRDQRDDVRVDEPLQERDGQRLCGGGHDDGQDNDGQTYRVLGDVTPEPFDGAAGDFRARLAAGCIGRLFGVLRGVLRAHRVSPSCAVFAVDWLVAASGTFVALGVPVAPSAVSASPWFLVCSS